MSMLDDFIQRCWWGDVYFFIPPSITHICVVQCRWFINLRRNWLVKTRNERRVQSANLLLSSSGSTTSADTLVQEKLASAREVGKIKVLSSQDAIYSSALSEERTTQMATQDLEDFDEVLKRRGGWWHIRVVKIVYLVCTLNVLACAEMCRKFVCKAHRWLYVCVSEIKVADIMGGVQRNGYWTLCTQGYKSSRKNE